MDLKGRNSINDALEVELKIADQPCQFSIKPSEWELVGGEEATSGAEENVRFLDIYTHAEPSRVLQALKEAQLLEGSVVLSKKVPSAFPVLRLLGITSGSSTVLTFEDIAQE